MTELLIGGLLVISILDGIALELIRRELRAIRAERTPVQQDPPTEPVASVGTTLPPPEVGAPEQDTGRHFLRDAQEMLAPPPMIAEVTVRDYLVHNHPERSNAWPTVVHEFYSRAADVPWIADYFRNVDREVLEQHFTRALVLVLHTGVTAGLVRKMGDVHAAVRDSYGRPITPAVWDAVIGTLLAVLHDNGVPASADPQIGAVVEQFRPALVVE